MPSSSSLPSHARRAAAVVIAAIALLHAPHAGAQMQIEGQTVEPSAQVGGRELVLNGAGVREIAWFKGYVAALYLPARTANAELALAGPGPKRLQMRMLMEATAADFIKAIDRGLDRHVGPLQLQALQPQRSAFDALVRAVGQVRRGDVIDLDDVPGSGLVFKLNGHVRGQPIAGSELHAALLSIFIGDKVSDARLKAELLGAAADR